MQLKPELSLILASARTGDAQEKQAIIEQLLADGIDWTSFAQKALAHGMASFAAHTLARLAPDHIPGDILDAFHAIADETSRANRALFDELARLLDALATNGVEAIPIKGPVLAIQVFGDLGLREFRDLDFLVRDEDLAKTIATLKDLGYPRTGEITTAQFDLIHRLQGQEIILGKASGTAVEPHTRLTPLKMALEIDYAGLWGRVQRIRVNSHTFLTPAAEDGLLLLAVHGGKEMWRKLKWACDFAGFVESFPKLDWTTVAERARAQGCLRLLLLATSLARRYFNSAIPPAIVTAERGDPTIKSMVRRIVEQWQADEPAQSSSDNLIYMDWLRLQDGFVRQACYLARTICLPGPPIVSSMRLPRHLSFAYIPIKLAHDLVALPLWQAFWRALAPVGRLPYAFAASGIALAVIPASTETKLTISRYRRAQKDAQRSLARAPNDPAALRDLGDALFGLRRYRGAIACYDQALANAPHDTTTWMRRLTAIQATGAPVNFPDIPSNPQDAKEWAIYAARLFRSRRYAQAIEASDRAIALDPDNVAGARVGIHTRLRTCDWRRREDDERRVSEEVKAGRRIVTPSNHRAISNSEAESLALARLSTNGLRPTEALWRGERYGHDKIRIAYSSTDFRDHVLSDAMLGCFEQHDGSRFQTTAISLGPDDGSMMRRRITAAFDRFIDVQAVGDFEVAKLLRESEIDIVVDLNGNSGDCRTGIFAHRPVPVQVSFLGYPGTMGLSLFEYIIADAVVIPNRNRVHYAEQVVYMPHTYMPNDKARQILPKAPSRVDARLPTTGVVFAFHDSEHKITPEIFDLWMRLLKIVDDSVLWLKSPNPSALVNLRREASARGVASERLVFAPRVPQATDHLARLQLADLFLDTRPYNASAGVCDALWAGVPVVTCPGDTFPGRVAASLLHAIGLPELVTASLAEYEGLASALALDTDRLARIKAKLKRNRDTEPLFDTARFTRDLESAYTIMWKRQQDGLPAASFAVDAAPACAA